MKVPDLISPITAYRAWTLTDKGIQSIAIQGVVWERNQPTEALCFRTVVPLEHDDGSGSPKMNCQCGIYAAKNYKHLHEIGYIDLPQSSVYGEVQLWGKVLEHELGWRAQYAYPKNFILARNRIPRALTSAEQILAALAGYNVPIFTEDDGEVNRILVWDKHSGGYQKEFSDWIIERSREWALGYKPTVQIGDKVALPRLGFGIVKYIGPREWFNKTVVVMTLRNNTEGTVLAESITWNENNNRFEFEGNMAINGTATFNSLSIGAVTATAPSLSQS